MPKSEIDRPLLVKEWAKSIGVKRAVKSNKKFELQLQNLLIPTEYRKELAMKKGKPGSFTILAKSAVIGKHYFPPNIKTVSVNNTLLKKAKLTERTEGLFAKHLGLKQFPEKLSKELRVKQRFGLNESAILKKGLSIPTTIFSPEDRFAFSDTSFPWSTCGRVDTASGWGSGVMIGPRHFMTASHVINWGPNNTAGWVKFTPLRFDNSEPFGSAFATKIYSWNKADGSDGLNRTEGAFDYVVCVLNTRMGDLTGWMGSRTYNTAWEGGNYWGHIGYPSDFSGGQRPIFVGYQSFTDRNSASLNGRSSFEIRHKIDVIPGQSGGPYFGWWDAEPWPRVVGIQSGQLPSFNTSGGGDPLPELISYARNTMP
ncbi:MAG: hypothetical protein ABI844_09265 [Saprospiraceae bacterium]